MRTSELLHFAFRARDPLALGRWYAQLEAGDWRLQGSLHAPAETRLELRATAVSRASP